MPPSFFEDDTVDFPDDLDTSFFTRVSSGHDHDNKFLKTVRSSEWMCWFKALSCGYSALNSYQLSCRLCRTACRMSCPAMRMRFSRPHRRLPSNSWMRASSQEVRWIGMNWRGVTSCCGFIFFLQDCSHAHTNVSPPDKAFAAMKTLFYDATVCTDWKILHLTHLSLSSALIQAFRARMAEDEGRLSGPT